MGHAGPRAHRVEVTEVAPSLGAYDYFSAFAVVIPDDGARTPEQGPGPLSEEAPKGHSLVRAVRMEVRHEVSTRPPTFPHSYLRLDNCLEDRRYAGPRGALILGHRSQGGASAELSGGYDHIGALRAANGTNRVDRGHADSSPDRALSPWPGGGAGLLNGAYGIGWSMAARFRGAQRQWNTPLVSWPSERH